MFVLVDSQGYFLAGLSKPMLEGWNWNVMYSKSFRLEYNTIEEAEEALSRVPQNHRGNFKVVHA